ncbi:MAG: SusC/RagA family TonB-linked outer membrane protein [Mangrovibacterium sp.]
MKKIFFLSIISCLIMIQAFAQPYTLSGVVKDETGTGIPGANITVEGTTTGTITDLDGNFRLQVDRTAKVLVASFIGYKTQRVEIGTRTTFNISLEVSNTDLDEVVVVGFGAQKKVSVVGAISNINSEELAMTATPNLSNSIGGRVSGVIVKLGEGRPGADSPQVNIRGIGTLNNSSPLILIDGMEGDMGRINPDDIESFSVLKDASATAVYGVRGANGVILITTKRGLVGKPVITINGQYRMHSIINYPNYLRAYDYARLYNEALINGGNPLRFNAEDLEHFRTGDSPYTHPDVDWFDAMVDPLFPEQRYDVSLRGGTEKVKYFVSGEFISQEGAYRQFKGMENSTNAGYKRFNLRMNYDFAVTKATNLNLSLNGRIQDTRNNTSGNRTASSTRGLWDDIAWTSPVETPLLNPDGSIAASGNTGNLEYALLRTGGYERDKDNDLRASVRLDQKLDFITKGLSFRLMAGSNVSQSYQVNLDKHDATYIYNPVNDSYTVSVQRQLPTYTVGSKRVLNNTYIESALSYDRTFGNHAITALALYNQDKISANSNPWTAHRGFAGRLTYAFNNKYLGEVNLGYNGSTQFETQERYTLLPAFSAGWVISEENFFKNLFPAVTFLKLRGSYGTVGNDKIGDYDFLYLAVFEGLSGADSYLFGDAYQRYNAIREVSLANEDVSWEIAKKQNYGFDMEIKDGLLGLGFDYFLENRSNILAKRRTITQVFGLLQDQLPAENFGKVRNRGFEIEARFNKKIKDFSISMNGTFSKAKNKIIDIDEVKYDLDYKNQTGKSIGQFFGYTWSGEFYSHEELGYVWDETVQGANKYVLPEGATPSVPVFTAGSDPGDLKFVDRNDDGVIDDYDIGKIGKTALPEFIYGLNCSFKYKGIGLNMFWQGAGGFNLRLYGQYIQEFLNNSKIHEMHLGRWAFYEDPFTGELIDTRATATYPRLIIGGSPELAQVSTFTLLKGDYLRLKNLELTFDLPKSAIDPLKIKDVVLFLTVSNVLTFSKVKFMDPENPSQPSSYPQTRFYGAGIKITL